MIKLAIGYSNVYEIIAAYRQSTLYILDRYLQLSGAGGNVHPLETTNNHWPFRKLSTSGT